LEFNVPFQHKYGYIRDDGAAGEDGTESFTMLLASGNSVFTARCCTDLNLVGLRVSFSDTGSPGLSWITGREMVIVTGIVEQTCREQGTFCQESSCRRRKDEVKD